MNYLVCRHICVIAFCQILLACSPTTDLANSGLSKDVIELTEQLEELLKWFPGEYDNHQQVYREAVERIDEDHRHRQTHHIFQPITMTVLPGRLIYAQQSQHYDLKDIYRQRVYSFQIDTSEKAIRLTIYTPKEPELLTDAHLYPDKWKSLSADDFILKPGCDVFWIKKEGQFEGYLKHNACNYYSERFGKRVFLNETLTLSKDALLLDDRAVDEEGQLIFGVDDKGPTINLKQKECK